MIYSIGKTEHDIDYGILIMQREKKADPNSLLYAAA
jgi:hypothetical protein